jgi:hypothetical protein
VDQEEMKDRKLDRDYKTLNKIQKYYTRFINAENAVSAKHERWRILDLFDRGQQWENSNLPPWIPKPVTNFIRYFRTLKRANLASAIPSANFYPEHPADAETVKNLQKAYNHVWHTDKVDRTIRRCIDRAILQGTAIAYVYNDDAYVGGKYYGEEDPNNHLYVGKICVKRIPNGNFFPDPNAYSLDECKFIEITEVLPLEEVKNTPAYKKYAGKKLQDITSADLDFDTNASGDFYERKNTKLNTSLTNVKGDELVTVHTHWERYMTSDGRWQVDVSYYLRNSDFFLLRIEDVKPNQYPFAILYDEEEENDFWGRSTCEDVLENSRIINRTAQTAAILATLHQNPQKVVWKESGINAQELAKTGNLPGKTMTSNVPANQAVNYINPPEISRSLFEIEDRLKNDMREIVGVTEAYTGQSVGSLTTSTGVNSLIERSSVRDKDKMSQIDDFVERVSYLILLNIMYGWDRVRPIMSIQPNGEPRFDIFEPIDPLTADNLEIRVRSNVYSKAPITQESKRQQADKLMQMQGQFNYNPPIITPEEWLRFQDFDIQDDIMRRMEEDRKKAEQQSTGNLAKQALELGLMINEMLQQGMTLEQAQVEAMKVAQQMQEQQTQGQQPNAPEQAVPQGTTDALAMQAMAQGM